MKIDNHSIIVTAKEVKADSIICNDEVFTFHATGLTRRVFVNKDRTKVIKVPVSKHDFEHNRNEDEMWENMNEKFKHEFAECKLLKNGWLEMEFLTTFNDPTVQAKWGHLELTPEQMQFAASSRNEVGFDNEGNLKCFDYDEYRKY